MAIMNALASVAVKDLNSAAKWYEKLFERPASRPMPEVAEWNFERGGWLQVYQLPERAGSGSFTLAVSDVEAQAAQLRKLNIKIGERSAFITAKMALPAPQLEGIQVRADVQRKCELLLSYLAILIGRGARLCPRRGDRAAKNVRGDFLLLHTPQLGTGRLDLFQRQFHARCEAISV